MEWSHVHLPNVRWGRGEAGSFNPYLTLGGVTYRPIGISTDGPSLNVRVELLKDPHLFARLFARADFAGSGGRALL